MKQQKRLIATLFLSGWAGKVFKSVCFVLYAPKIDFTIRKNL
jgi:hypothetical protein